MFNKLFVPSFDPLIGTLLAFTTYAVGFVARPVGGIGFRPGPAHGNRFFPTDAEEACFGSLANGFRVSA